MRKSKKIITTLLCAALAGAALLSYAGCGEAASPYKVYGGYTELTSGEGNEGGTDFLGYYYYSFGFLQNEYALDEVEMTFYFAMEQKAFTSLLNNSGLVSDYDFPRSCNTYCYAYQASKKAELETTTFDVDKFFAHATLNKAENGVCLFNKIEIENFKQMPYETYRIETDRDKDKGFGSIADNRQIGYSYSQQVKIPREMFEGEKGEIYFSAKGMLVCDSYSTMDVGTLIYFLLPESSPARIYYQVKGGRVRIAATEGFD
ncbi:MAG: hypothetical protein K2N84_00070 [Clostridia bacterium]|nr:hypothetical protein [Clostridia bacterium]